VTVMEANNPTLAKVGEEIYEELTGAGLEVLLDDRELSPGAKLKDADLIGIPVQAVIGKVWQAGQQVELSLRATKEKTQAGRVSVVEAVHKLLDKASSL